MHQKTAVLHPFHRFIITVDVKCESFAAAAADFDIVAVVMFDLLELIVAAAADILRFVAVGGVVAVPFVKTEIESAVDFPAFSAVVQFMLVVKIQGISLFRQFKRLFSDCFA